MKQKRRKSSSAAKKLPAVIADSFFCISLQDAKNLVQFADFGHTLDQILLHRHIYINLLDSVKELKIWLFDHQQPMQCSIWPMSVMDLRKFFIMVI